MTNGVLVYPPDCPPGRFHKPWCCWRFVQVNYVRHLCSKSFKSDQSFRIIPCLTMELIVTQLIQIFIYPQVLIENNNTKKVHEHCSLLVLCFNLILKKREMVIMGIVRIIPDVWLLICCLLTVK